MATPPRAWGRLSTLCHPGRGQGNTPTSVGKTRASPSCGRGGRKHPHERGEDRQPCCPVWIWTETPPRAWGRPAIYIMGASVLRNTPTSVGKTAISSRISATRRKHPHERGEDAISNISKRPSSETPPRAWGRHGMRKSHPLKERNTPTSVGKTLLMRRWSRHLRETPPRAWGRPPRLALAASEVGNTPTSVGKTFLQGLQKTAPQKHPHERGEDGLQ